MDIVGERERPNLDLAAMFGLHNVPSAHNFPFVKDRSTCSRYMRIVHRQNGTYLTLSARQSPDNWHAAVCARAILAYLQVAPWNQEEVYTASVSNRRLQRMPSNGGDVRENV